MQPAARHGHMLTADGAAHARTRCARRAAAAQLSFEQIGAAAMLSRAVGGLAGRKFLFALPGSSHAVKLALARLILPQMAHMLAQLRGI